jgi:exopolysaccharide biosynthesis predicted pyruvyltransferase EpsI
VRDLNSKIFLEKIGVEKNKIQIATDCAFLKDFGEKKKSREKILFVFHGAKFLDNNFQTIKNFIQNFSEKFEFLPLQKLQTGDQKIAEKLGVKPLNPGNLEEVVEIFQSAKLVISQRFHGIIFSILTETPFLAFSEMLKVKDFLASCDLTDFFIDQNF